MRSVRRWVLVGVVLAGAAIVALGLGVALDRQGGPSVPRAEAAGADALGIAAGGGHSCALFEGGTAKCWGDNFRGQLGDGTLTASRTLPAPVCASGSGAGCPALAGIASLAAGGSGGDHTCALTTTGGVKCWGQNDRGQLGIGSLDGDTHPLPLDVSGLSSGVVAVATGESHSCAVLDTGGVKCWGDDGGAKLGDGSATDPTCICRMAPVDVCATGFEDSCVPLTGAVNVSLGGEHSCALMSGGGVKCWGQNSEYQLGDGTQVHPRPNPVDVCASGGTGMGCVPLSNVTQVAAGATHTCALVTGGGVKCWGENFSGQLGDGTGTARLNPVDVCTSGMGAGCPALTGAASLGLGFDQSCAALLSGQARCWGDNSSGQLGDGTTINRNRPAAVCASGSGPACPPLPDVAAVAGGIAHSCAVLADGSARCWGGNTRGQLGNGSTEQSLLPAVVVLKDSDGDGCSDAQELGANPALGGQRDPDYFWDFFDVPTGSPLARDRAVTAGDIAGVVQRFGATGSAAGDPLSLPPPAPAYHTAYDRGGVMPGQDPWDLQPADGSITAGDIAASVAQFGHSCA